ncbi:MAG TPA: ATP-binding protein, partial [Vicinamibacteria bacterium]|nr:ATP-binding protein [Vicinamibacteria bacterium]
MKLDRRLCAIDGVVRDVASLVEHKAKDQGITVDIEIAPRLPEVMADPELLKTCLLNLAINALDAMPSGGRLSLALGAEPGALVVRVQDTGGGMTSEQVGTAFEPYVSSKETGFGLGLALTRQIVDDHGGTISLDSVPARGTTVVLRLPLPSPADERRPAALAS